MFNFVLIGFVMVRDFFVYYGYRLWLDGSVISIFVGINVWLDYLYFLDCIINLISVIEVLIFIIVFNSYFINYDKVFDRFLLLCIFLLFIRLI